MVGWCDKGWWGGVIRMVGWCDKGWWGGVIRDGGVV